MTDEPTRLQYYYRELKEKILKLWNRLKKKWKNLFVDPLWRRNER